MVGAAPRAEEEENPGRKIRNVRARRRGRRTQVRRTDRKRRVVRATGEREGEGCFASAEERKK